MRIAFAEIAQETDSFSPMVADLADFEAFGLFFGGEMLEKMRGVGPIGGFLEVAAEQDEPVELLPLVRAWGGAGGTITAKTLDFLTERLIADLKKVLPVDAVYLALHGAAASENEDDVEGHVLEAVRQVVGKSIPIAVCLDHHANITERMVQFADVLIGHETQPHDPVATGRKTARAVPVCCEALIHPTMAWRKISNDHAARSVPDFSGTDARVVRTGAGDGAPARSRRRLSVSNAALAGCRRRGLDGRRAHGKQPGAGRSARHRECRQSLEPARAVLEVGPGGARRSAVLSEAVAAGSGLVILSDTGDSVYGGGSESDSTCILRDARWSSRFPAWACWCPIVDAEVVDIAHAAGVGRPDHGRAGMARSEAAAFSAGRCALRCSAWGRRFEGGHARTAGTRSLRHGELRLIGSRTDPHRRADLAHVCDQSPCIVYAPGIGNCRCADRRREERPAISNGLQPLANWELIRVDSPGMTQSDLTAFEWKRVPRPMYPLDEIKDWQPLYE